jgi:RNA polymerase sigma factor FliA
MNNYENRDGMANLVDSHLDFAHAIAAETLKKLPGTIDRADVERAAELGLVQAANAYDPSRGISFATFAYYRVRGAIYDDLRQFTRMNKFGTAANAYMMDYSSLATSATTSQDQYQEVRSMASHIVTSYLLSLDSVPREPASQPSDSPLQRVLRKERQKQLREALIQMPEKNRKVIERYYFDELTFGEIARELGVSESSAWRIHAKSLEMIRSILDQRMEERKKAVSKQDAEKGLQAKRPTPHTQVASFSERVPITSVSNGSDHKQNSKYR